MGTFVREERQSLKISRSRISLKITNGSLAYLVLIKTGKVVFLMEGPRLMCQCRFMALFHYKTINLGCASLEHVFAGMDAIMVSYIDPPPPIHFL